MGGFQFTLDPTPACHPVVLSLGGTDSSHQEKVGGKKRNKKNLSSCSLNVVVCKGVWRECCSWLAGGRCRWKALGTTLGLSGCLSLWSGDIKWCLDPFLVAQPHVCNTQGPAVPYPPKYNVSTRVQLVYLSTIVPQTQNKIPSVSFKTRAEVWMNEGQTVPHAETKHIAF